MSTAAVPLRAHLRDPGEVALGLGAERALVLSGLSDAETRAVIGLGPMTARQWGSAHLVRPPSTRWPDVVRLLGDAASRLTGPDAVSGSVTVAGVGSVPDAIRDVLTGMGARADPDHTTLAVLIAAEHVPARAAERWRRDGVPHLPVVLGAGRAVIGPLIRPGVGPCLGCLDHHRAVRDPGWAAIAAGGPWDDVAAIGVDAPGVLGMLGPVSAPADLRAVVSGLVGLVARGHLSGQPLPVGVSVTVTTPSPRVQHRLWRAHPRCCPDADG
ncbi:hypothetical protein [Allobranchiibius huperziae]|uniref:Bacteriocin biosynthesis cyclodehydratase domain-containing protein n=2 Tax=Allobranchiibius TaxID=2040262 RepID=A0A853DB82_9MICO|nr:hypothetical protein [Allobranchiibius huperziae]NYJ73857.1 hypothetical protein [Allobranchiibius huperziae]